LLASPRADGSCGIGDPDREERLVKKVLTWSIIALLLYLVVQDPQSATRLVSGTIDLLGRIAEGATAVVNGV
jgi:hypothetical protein